MHPAKDTPSIVIGPRAATVRRFATNADYRPARAAPPGHSPWCRTRAIGSTAQEFAAFHAQERTRWKPVIERARIKPD